jgi:hypothetical protein
MVGRRTEAVRLQLGFMSFRRYKWVVERQQDGGGTAPASTHHFLGMNKLDII